MTKYAWSLFVLSLPAFCQGLNGTNAAQSLLERRFQSMRLIEPADLRKPVASKFTTTISPQVCAIGLAQVQVQGGGAHESWMPVLRPSKPPLKGEVIKPMPVCSQ
jgi:hypothetical protein